MNRIVYCDPSVRIIDGTRSDIGYDIWCQSKSSVVTIDGDKVKIGKSVKSDVDYFKEITNMNMQYNNLPMFIFEIKGSILFRDLIYNINKASQWAVSLRLLHSVRDRNDISNYVVSSEYKNIKEWEDAFFSYYEGVLKESRTDKNRVTMPYSIQSTYWIGINFKSLVNLLTMLKVKMPFFYNVYGILFENAMNQVMPFKTTISEFYGNDVNSSISKYFTKNPSEFTESAQKVDDYYLVKQKMSLILYSQFIRQADVEVKGLWDLLVHDSPTDFVHKVFTGDTLINTTYLANVDRVRTTISNRTCWFSQSDGDENDPHYWSKFLSTFLKGLSSIEEFKDILPCKFCDHKLIQCKYKQDVKFRDEGLQEGYIPCSILNSNLEYAEKRREQCNNNLNNWYYKVTKDIVRRGLNHEFSGEYWTSKLTIYGSSPIEPLAKNIESIIDKIENRYSKFIPERSIDFDNLLNDYDKSYGLGSDVTCMLKGLAIDMIAELMSNRGISSYIINFGGDIYMHNASQRIGIDGTNFMIDLSGNYSIFTSGNTKKRGNHISGGPEHRFNTLIINWGADDNYNNKVADIASTKLFAGDKLDDYLIQWINNYQLLEFSEDGQLLTPTYCASPFFNDEQISIRDKMVSKFDNAFRPDLTDASEKYNNQKDDESVNDVFNANVDGISESPLLVFPQNTSDLGTLYEVGRAMALNHYIIKYNEDDDKYIIIHPNPVVNIDTNKDYVFDCSKKMDAIAVGYISLLTDSSHIFYELNGCKDNIMLSVHYHHVEKDGEDKYAEQFRDPSDRDE